MADIDYILEIVAKLRDEASPGIDRLKAKLDSLKATNDVENAEKNLGKAVEDTGRKTDDSRRKEEALRSERERSRRASEDASRGAKNLADDVDRTSRSHDKSSDSVGAHTKAQEDFAEALAKVRREQQDTGEGLDDLDLKMSKLRSSWSNFDQQLKSGSLSKGEAKRGLREYASEFDNLGKKLETGSEEWRSWGREADNVAKKLKGSDFAATGGFLDNVKRGDVGSALESIGSKFDGLGIRITGVSSFLRGFFELAKIGFSQQLITGVASLAGGLFSVASAATQAGAALAGAFVSGLGQAIPMLAIVGASLERFKSILQAVSIAGQAEQQHFYDPTEKQVTQLQNASQLISANQQLSNSYIQLFEAQQRVRDSQISLTEARYTAKRQITELSMAEKDARLQAEGANLSLAESRRQLQIAIQKGDTGGLQQAELAVKEAELSKEKTDYAVPKAEREARLAKQRGVSGAPSVISAVEGLEGSRVAVRQAQQAGEAAKRQAQIVQLQQAARSSKETSTESQLKFAEKGMSSTELGLTNSLIGLEKELKSPDSPLKKITDYIVEPFANAVQRVRSLLKDNNFLGPIDELAKAMGAGLSRLEKATFGKQGTSFFETMAKDASSNIPIVVSSLEHLMHLFEDVAKAADPAFHKLSEDWNNFWASLDKKDSSESGLTRLKDFFNKGVEYAESFAKLGKALFDLFKAIGSDAAPQGNLTITSFTSAIKEATNWVDGHKSSVVNFFKEAREGLSLLGQLLFGIGKSLVEVFSLSSLKAFNQFIQQIILPALRDVVKLLGFLTKLLLEVANAIPGGKSVLEGLVGVFLSLEIVGKIAGPIMETVKALQALYKATKALLLIEGVSKAWSDAKGVFTSTGAAAADAAKVTGAATATEGTEATVAEGEVATANAGLITLLPEITAAAAVVAGAYGAVKGLEALGILNDKSYEKPGTRIPATPGQPARSQEEVERGILEGHTNKTSRMGYGKTQLTEVGKGFEENFEVKKEKINPVLSEIEKNFGKLVSNVGPVFPKIKNIVEENSEIIRKTLGTKSLEGKEALKENFSDAITWIEASMKRGKIATADGMKDIRDLVHKELKTFGVNPTEIAGVARGAASAGKSVAKGLEGFAAGGYIPATPGGRAARVGEGGHDEVVLSTDPAHAQRSRALLGQYFSRAPHMAEGGFVADPGTNFTVNQEPKIVAELRRLGEYLHTTIYGISGYRSPSHSVEIGGFADDPHTRGEAADIGVGSNTLESASKLTAAILSKFDLYRPFFPASAHEINHVQLMSGTAAGIVGTSAGTSTSNLNKVMAEISAPKIKGGGAVGQVAQGALNLATKAANIFLSKQTAGEPSSSSGSIGNNWSGTWVHVMEQIAKAKNWSLSAWRNVINAESGGDPNARNPSSGAYGIGQFLGSTLTEYAKYGATSSDPTKQIEAMAQYISDRYVTPTAAWAHETSDHWYDVGGIVANTPSGGYTKDTWANNLLWSLGLPRDRKNIESIVGWENTEGGNWRNDSKYNPLNTTMSEPGSRNTGSQGDIKSYISWKQGLEATVSTLRSGLYNNILKSLQEKDPRKFVSSVSKSKWGTSGDLLAQVVRGEVGKEYAQGGIAPWGGRPVPIIAHEGERIMNPSQYGETARLAGTTPGGLDRHLGYDGSPRQSFAAGGIPKFVHASGTAQPQIESFIPTELEVGTLNDIIKIFKKIKEGFKNLKKVSGREYATKLASSVEEIIVETNGVLAKLQEGREYFKTKLQRSAVSKEYTVRGNQVSLGPQGQAGIDTQNLNALNEEAKYLEQERNIIKQAQGAARKIKNSNERRHTLNILKLKEKEFDEAIDSNIEARYQAAVQAFQDAINLMNSNYQIESQKLTNQQSLAQNMGNLNEIGPLDEQIKASAEAQYHRLGSALISAQGTGNTELVNTIKQEMVSLEATIFGSIAERISNAQTIIQRESQQLESRTSARLGYSKVLSQEGKYEAAGKEEKSALTEKQANLLSTRTQEEQLREQAIREGDTAAAITLGEAISKNNLELAENSLALKENAVITRELIVSQIEATGQFKSGIYSAAQQGLETIGRTTGFTNVPGLLSAAKGREGALGAERSGLEGAAAGIGLGVEGMTPAQILTYLASPAGQSKLAELEKNEDKAEKEQLYKLVQALETNATNTLKNSEEIAKLNGSLNQPQSFSTSSWQQMRGAFFNGMGGLLPQYASALPPGALEGMPKYGEMAPGAARTGPTIGTLNMTHPVERLDPNLFGEQLSHIISTTPSMS